jgi:CRISPR locus-related DNA-binding protein
MNIHLALVGKIEGPILSGIQLYGAVDKVYLLHSTGTDGTESVATKIKIELEPLGIRQIIFKVVDPFSMNSVVHTITNIAREESSNNLFVNITGGTNLMAGAATATSFFVGAQAYYIRDPNKLPKDRAVKELLVELPVPRIPYHGSLNETQLSILQLVARRSGKIINKTIKDELNLSPQITSYHTKELKKKKLITAKSDEKDSRKNYLSITHAGNLVIAWTTNS